MQDSMLLSRRKLLAGLGAGAGLMTAGAVVPSAAAQSCGAVTPTQILGPFFPERKRDDEDLDLTHVAGREGTAEGEIVIVRGQVLDEKCLPVEDALVEIWQANKWGRYDHERDADNPRPLDPNFQSWARFVTAKDGRFRLKTIKPGSYPADNSGWIRPPHIHFKVSRRGYHELVTQMYFEGEELNEKDRLRIALPPEERARLTIAFAPAESDPGARQGQFHLTLRRA